MDKRILEIISRGIDESLSVNEKINFDLFDQNQIEVFFKREDLMHPLISGNKWRKLKYNLKDKHKTYFTFGGAYSNHIFSMAAACKKFGIKSVAFIRGEELKEKSKWSKTLNFAHYCGMELVFINRDEYRLKNQSLLVKSLTKIDWQYIPEGGSNMLAIKGCEEICSEGDFEMFDYICVCVGTGATAAGIINKSKGKSKILAFSVVNHQNVKDDILRFLNFNNIENENFEIIESHFGKYGVANETILNFIYDFENNTKIHLDKVYTGKMIYRLKEMIFDGKFAKNSKILVVHTGGYQENWII